MTHEAEALQEAIETVCARMISGIHTSMPGSVESYDSAAGTVDVKPLIKLPLSDGSIGDLPVIPDVPLVFPGTADFGLDFPVEVGTGVLLIFCERSIEGWQQSGQAGESDDGRKHSISDAVAIPGLFSSGKGIARKGDGAARIIFGKAEVVMQKSGSISFNNGALEIKP